MRIPILLASAAALAIAGCGNHAADSADAANSSSASQDSPQVSDQRLEQQVMDALKDAPKNGLTKDLFLKGNLPSSGPQRRQALLSAVQNYASALANGKVDPSKLHDVYTLARPKVDVSGGLKQAIEQNKLRQWLVSLPPQTPEYQALSKEFVKLVQRSPDLPDQKIPSGGVVHKGEKDKRVPLIVQNLQALGYLPPDSKQQQFSGTTFTPAMSQALARFQSDSGLKSDGVIGPNTVQALNNGPRDRARALAVAMERLRWLQRDPPGTRIDVNTAAAILDYYRNGQQADERKVIVGQPDWETPQLGTEAYALVANPNWVVPKSIASKELADKSQGWLSSHNFVQKNGHWVQQPGPDSALGVVKFALKDDQAIYLHDTPSKYLFKQSDRHDSHGCIRVQNALQFAHMIASQEGIDSKFSSAMATGNETQVNLPNHIPVRLMYHTAYLGNDGRIHYADDVYGWDNAVASALGYATRKSQQGNKKSGDIGP